MEDAGREHRVGARLDRRGEVLDGARPAAGDHGDVDEGPDPAQHLEVEAVLGAVGVHRVQQDLPDAELGAPLRPLQRVDPGAAAAAVGGDLEPGRDVLRPSSANPSGSEPSRSTNSAAGNSLFSVLEPGSSSMVNVNGELNVSGLSFLDADKFKGSQPSEDEMCDQYFPADLLESLYKGNYQVAADWTTEAMLLRGARGVQVAVNTTTAHGTALENVYTIGGKNTVDRDLDSRLWGQALDNISKALRLKGANHFADEYDSHRRNILAKDIHGDNWRKLLLYDRKVRHLKTTNFAFSIAKIHSNLFIDAMSTTLPTLPTPRPTAERSAVRSFRPYSRRPQQASGSVRDGACFKCGQRDHNYRECTNPAAPRPLHFKGEANIPVLQDGAPSSICRNWNRGNCTTNTCRRDHVCTFCYRDHRATDCTAVGK